MMFQQATHLLLSFLALTATVTTCTASMIVSESRTRLPMSLSTVISDLEAEGMEELSMACLVTSRSVTAAQKQAVLDGMLGADEHLSASSKAVATVKGLALAQPSELEEVVQSTVACEGLVIYVPSSSDLYRGEGLLDSLAPAMERLMQWQASPQSHESSVSDYSNKACLVVVCDPKVGKESTKAKLEAAAEPILKTMGSTGTSNKRQLDDIFGSVLYLFANEVEPAVLDHRKRPQQTTTPEEAMARVASVVAADGNLFAPLASTANYVIRKIASQPQELAAARKLEPAKRQALQTALQVVQEATAGNTQLVTNFGSLCDAALQQAQDNLSNGGANQALLQSTSVGKDLSASLASELASEWMDAYEQQLKLLEDACFATMRQSMSKLRLGATLAHDMQTIVKETVQSFGRQVQKLIPQHAGLYKSRAGDAKAALAKKLQDFCQDRLQAAEASGQFRPVPRKGVTVGFHWLLPKPFGNDFRQEPWMVHATDNLVYVPRRASKVTEVPEESVATTGDWRDALVPSPAGRDMIYMQ